MPISSIILKFRVSKGSPVLARLAFKLCQPIKLDLEEALVEVETCRKQVENVLYVPDFFKKETELGLLHCISKYQKVLQHMFFNKDN